MEMGQQCCEAAEKVEALDLCSQCFEDQAGILRSWNGNPNLTRLGGLQTNLLSIGRGQVISSPRWI